MRNQMKLLGMLLLFIGISCTKDIIIVDDSESVPQSESKEITKFSFLSADNEELEQDVVAIINQDSLTIKAKVPFGTEVTALTPTINISPKASINPTGVQDFTEDVAYTVIAEDDSKAVYTVTVEVAKSNEKEITGFKFLAADNESLTEDVVATVDQDSLAIHATVPFGTDISNLVAAIDYTPGAVLSPEKGAQDYNKP